MTSIIWYSSLHSNKTNQDKIRDATLGTQDLFAKLFFTSARKQFFFAMNDFSFYVSSKE